jgi:hypothetical protein
MSILMAKSASYDWVTRTRMPAPDVSVDKAFSAGTPVASPNPAVVMQRGSPEPIEYENPPFLAPAHPPSPAPIKDAAPTDGDDYLSSARGFVNGVFIAVPLWIVIGGLTRLFLAW